MDSNELTPLADPDAFEGESLRDVLAMQLSRGQLTLVLGAGVSAGFGFPTWQLLLDQVAAALGCSIPSSLNHEQAGEFLLGQCNYDRDRFAALVRTVLYRDADLSMENLIGKPLLVALGALTMASIRGSVSRVLTFNFDDLLETYLRYHGFMVESVGIVPTWNTPGDVAVLHNHGLLPADPKAPGTRIVFAQSDYDAVVGKNQHAWRRSALEILTSHTCLFVGLSGNDSNLTSLLEEVRDTHPGVRRGDAFWGVRFTFDRSDPLEGMWRNKGVKSCVLGDYADLPPLLLDVCQRAADRFRTFRNTGAPNVAK